MPEDKRVTSAVLIIGDEILSGRTQDTNLRDIARYLNVHGVDLAEARTVPDVMEEIVAALNALRARYNYVITTGGIGPTHDDITADCVAEAFGVKLYEHPEIIAGMRARYPEGELNAARRRMARVPDGGTLIKNSASVAPGFQIGNVFVMAGVPMVMRAMMEEILPRLPRGAPVLSVTISTALPEGAIAQGLADIQKTYPQTAIGSYPWYREGKFGAQLVVRSRDAAQVEDAAKEIEALAVKLGAMPERVSSA